MAFMRFSIITITFNAEEFLEKTLESVASQECNSYEHIIWDGGSQDRTLEIAQKYPVQVYQGQDEGIADAMNKGAVCAKGEILLHLHADDFLANAKVLSFVDTAFKQHPLFDWLYAQSYTVNKLGEILTQTRYKPFQYKKLRKYNLISHPSCFVKKRLFEEMGGFDKSLKYCMDYDLWLRLAEKYTPLVLPNVLSCFRAHDHSLSTKEPRFVANEAYLVRNRYLHSLFAKYRSYRTWKRRLETCS